MIFTPEMRLKLIREIVVKMYSRHPSFDLERIAFLCDMPNEFLEANRENYKDVIESVKRGGSIMFL